MCVLPISPTIVAASCWEVAPATSSVSTLTPSRITVTRSHAAMTSAM
jgi:hypothetical protein